MLGLHSDYNGVALESATLSTFPQRALSAPSAPSKKIVPTMVHELTHQYFGDTANRISGRDLTGYMKSWIYGRATPHAGPPRLEARQDLLNGGEHGASWAAQNTGVASVGTPNGGTPGDSWGQLPGPRHTGCQEPD
ncbi:hypothetical protein OG533_38940 [Streptomyces sp. NBC_01186]|nr:hypothetical protein OG533_38940 [Streptomyces sp. NBC_01186]